MQNHHIMVIEDDAVTLEFMEEFLSLYGYQVTLWNISARVVEQINRCKPDIVVLDQRLDRSTHGLEILQAMRSQPGTAHIPVILYSAENAFLRSHRDQVLAMGGDVLNKPFLADELLGKIRGLIENEPHSLHP